MKKMNWKKWVSILATVVLGTGALAGSRSRRGKSVQMNRKRKTYNYVLVLTKGFCAGTGRL